MRLGAKLIISFSCVSILIAASGLVSNWYTGAIQRQLLFNNIEITKVVDYTAKMERNLYQSLIYLNAIRDSGTNISKDGKLLEMPSVTLLHSQFKNEVDEFKLSFNNVKDFLAKNNDQLNTEQESDIKILEDRFHIYESLCNDWFEIITENPDQAPSMFRVSLDPFFRNRIIPAISNLREDTINRQNDENVRLNIQLDQANLVIQVFTVVAFIIAISIAFYIYKSIANPLMKLNDSTKVFGGGNLDERIEVLTKDEIGELATSFNEMAANLQKRTIARDYLDNIIESIQETLIVTDPDDIVVYMNGAGEKLLHYEKEESIGRKLSEFFDPEYSELFNSMPIEDNKTMELYLSTKEGEKIPVLFSRSELINQNNEKVGVVCVASNISERKSHEETLRRSLREKEVLLSEIHHRVKNNLAVISGLLQLQSYNSKDEIVKDALTESQSRIQSISIVHEMLYQNDSIAYIRYDAYIKELLHAISKMHFNSDKKIELTTDLDDISINLNQAIPLSLLLNEVVVNAYKHAFKGRKKGSIYISLKRKGEKIKLEVKDNGLGMNDVDPITTSSLGLTLIRTLTNQLHGDFEIRDNPGEGGTWFLVEFDRKGK